MHCDFQTAHTVSSRFKEYLSKLDMMGEKQSSTAVTATESSMTGSPAAETISTNAVVPGKSLLTD